MRINVLHWNEDVVMGGRMWCITPPGTSRVGYG